MSLPLSSQQTFYNLFVTTLQSKLATLSDTLPGSVIDGLGGTYSIAAMELQRQTTLNFNKTFIDLANGPAITGNTDDLQTLAVDHYGSAFARPGASASTDTETFTRPTNGAGAIDIPALTVVQTQPNANGTTQQYTTNSDVGFTHAGVVGFVVVAANATLGAVYKDANGASYTVTTTIVGLTALATTGTTLPPTSGTLTKFSGTGDATIAFTSFTNTDCYVTVPITATVSGSIGNAVAGSINSISSSLLDSTIVCSNVGNANGVDAQPDSTYRETIRNLILALRAAVKQAIQSAALTVSGITSATAVEIEQAVVTWNIGTNLPSAVAVLGIYEYFYIPYVTLYVAQATGAASAGQISAVIAAINPIRAFGVNITVTGASTVTVNWSAHYVLNPAGPNFSIFSGNMSAIVASMTQYIATLPTGTSFVRQTAEAAILAIYGPLGTNDLEAQYTFQITSASATVGATYTDGSGYTFTVVATVASSTAVICNSSGGAPLANGTLTKTTGTGSATIAFSSAATTMSVLPAADVSIGASQNAIPGTIGTV
jgi:hypothetical protein